MTMTRTFYTILVALLTTAMLNTALAEDFTPAETASGLTMLFAVENDALFGCPPALSAYDACAQLSYSTLFMSRTLVDLWVRAFSDTQWISAWVGDDRVVARSFIVDSHPGEIFVVGVMELSDRTVVIFQLADE